MSIGFVMFLIALVILGFLRVLSDMNSCKACAGTGRDKMKIKSSDGTEIEIDKGICPVCKGSGRYGS